MIRYNPEFAGEIFGPKKSDHKHYIHLASILHGPIDNDIYYLREDDPHFEVNFDYGHPETLMYFYHNLDAFPSNLKGDDGKHVKYINVRYDVNADAANRFTVQKADQSEIEDLIRVAWMVEVEHVIGLQLDLMQFVRTQAQGNLILSNLVVEHINSNETSDKQALIQKANNVNLDVYRAMTRINHVDSIRTIMRAFMGPLIHFPAHERFWFHAKYIEIPTAHPYYFAQKPIQPAYPSLRMPELSRGPREVDIKPYFEFVVERRATPLKDFFVANSYEKTVVKSKTIDPVPTGLAFEILWWERISERAEIVARKSDIAQRF